MAEFTVSNTNDSGAGSLRNALAQAEANGAGADEIVFSIAAGSVITLNSSLMITSGAVSINGDLDDDGDPDIVISGDTDGSGTGNAGDVGVILQIDTGASATLNSLQISDGFQVGSAGENAQAGIVNSGTLAIFNSIIDGHEAGGGNGEDGFFSNGEAGGDALAGIGNYGTLSITDSVVENNGATGGNGGNGDEYLGSFPGGYDGSIGGNGGSGVSGILNTGALTINTTSINGDATAGGGGAGDTYADGPSNIPSNGGNGGDEGAAVAGILNFGGFASAAGDFLMHGFNIAISGTPGSGSTGINGGTDGSMGGFSAANSGFTNDGGTGSPNFYGFYTNATSGNDVINGTYNSAETFFGLTGDDMIDGGGTTIAAQADLIFGGAGNDTLTAGHESRVYGGSGNDTIINNFIFGGTWDGGSGIDTFINAERGFSFTLNMVTGAASFDASIVNFENVTGNDGASDNIIGTDMANIITGRAGSDTIEGGLGDDTLDGGSEIDTVSFAGFTPASGDTGVTVNLKIAGLQDTNAGLDTITNFENITGSEFNDTLIGDTGENTISGGGGNDRIAGDGLSGQSFQGSNDILDGGTGTDTAVYQYGNDTGTSYTFAHGLGLSFTVTDAIQVELGGPGDGIDTLSNFEAVEFLDRTLTVLYGMDDGLEETVVGNAVDNILVTGSGDDYLNASLGNDVLLAGDGNDELLGGAGSDILDGGNNSAIVGQATQSIGDAALYVNSNFAVTINLDVGSTSGGHAIGDVLIGIENLVGSIHEDFLTGDGNANYIDGFNGNDTLEGGGGDDVLNGGNGDDTLMGDLGADFLNGGTGLNDLADYSLSGSGVIAGVNNGAVNTGGFAEGDVLFVEHITGSDQDDELRGNSVLNTLSGLGGEDFIIGGDNIDMIFGGDDNDYLIGGRGADTIDGGDGEDTLSFVDVLDANTARVFADMISGQFTYSGNGAGDTVSDIENLVGTRYDDFLYGDNLNNVLDGFIGNDTLLGRGGEDTLLGFAGNDTLNGGAGDDTLTGSSGIDSFLFDIAAFGDDTVTDFTNGVEMFDMSGSGWSFAQATITASAGDAIVTFNSGGPTMASITVTGMAGNIDETDFMF